MKGPVKQGVGSVCEVVGAILRSDKDIPDALPLVGDAVEDLPGVPGYGKQNVAIALGAFGRIDATPDVPAGCDGGPFALPRIRSALGELAWEGAPAGAFESPCSELGWGRIADRVPRPGGRG